MSEVELWQLINGADKSMSNTSRSKWGSCCFPDTHSIIICASLALWKEHINDSSHGEESPQSRNLVSSLFSRLSLKDTHVLQEGSDLCQKEVICVYWAQRRTRKDSDCDFALIYSQEHPPYSRDTLCFPHTEQENPQFTCLRVTAEGNPLLIFKETLSEIKFHWRSFHTSAAHSGWKHRHTEV